jgi:hypothetical protein
VNSPGGPAGPAQLCRVCAAGVPAGAARCGQCGAAFGALDPCPCCGATAGASPHAELRFACDVCGGPRVPRLDRSIQYSGREAALLRKADAARKGRAGWRAAAIADGLLLPIVLLVFTALWLLFGPGAGMVLVALVMVTPIAAFLAFAASRAGARGREISPALDAAWLDAATDVARQVPDLTAAALARQLGVDEPQAEELMALLDVNASLGVGSAGERAPAITGPRMRVAAGAGQAPVGAADEIAIAEREDEAALAERIEARVRSSARLEGDGKP